MTVLDKEKYKDYKDKNQNAHGSFRYAEIWADMMEMYLEDGDVKVKDIAKKTSCDANKQGITGGMYNRSISILAEHWIHGEELRNWYNNER